MSIKGTKKVKTIKKSYSVPEFLRSSKKKRLSLVRIMIWTVNDLMMGILAHICPFVRVSYLVQRLGIRYKNCCSYPFVKE